VAKRPWTVTVVAWLFIATGIVGFAYHATEIGEEGAVWVLVVRLLAVVAGVFMLRGAKWARWLAIAWLAYHVVLSAFHSVSETIAHVVILAVVSYALLREKSRSEAGSAL
jgi:uncharacterized membrane protein HdeD (DUF308 family)